MKQAFTLKLLQFWHTRTLIHFLLLPLSWLFQLISLLRYYYFRGKGPTSAKIPLIIVGNITVGGTGKTPLVAYLANYLHKQGYTPAILMHGYASSLNKNEISQVDTNSDVKKVGDEALWMASACKDITVLASRSRVLALPFIEKHFPKVDVIICDDGLQHYRLQRDIEIAVIDAQRRFGNGFCLPVGPLRESPQRLKRVDFIVANGKALENEWAMQTQLANTVTKLNDSHSQQTLDDFIGKKVHAVAGIGHPERFFNMLRDKGIKLIEHRFSDHHAYSNKDLTFDDNYPILMTEKDAVKCQRCEQGNIFVVRLEVKLPIEMMEQILRRLRSGQKATRHSRLPNLQATPPL
ncbi:MAG: tetraacyldisaccharide 4'-kinase [Proteobacteria bacterium]|nr:tetraacyldisaccharide 4'-kinase [Pseudomonadota bacterium]